MQATISASGTLEPEDVVDVGAQVVGQIIAFGEDPVTHKPIDYGSEVEPGPFSPGSMTPSTRRRWTSRALLVSAQAKVQEAKAQEASAAAKVDQAKANVEVADANVSLAKARATQSDRDWAAPRSWLPRRPCAPSDVDAAEAAFGTNRASVGVNEATLIQAKASVNDAEAALKQATATVADSEAAVNTAQAQLEQDELNLSYCVIKSPVKGVIIDRRVNIGQTVCRASTRPACS